MKEDGLLLEPVELEDVEVLRATEEAQKRFTGLLERTLDRVQKDIGNHPDPLISQAGNGGHPSDWSKRLSQWNWRDGGWCNYANGLETLGGAQVLLQWDFLGRDFDDQLPEPRVFAAGLSFEIGQNSADILEKWRAISNADIQVLADRWGWGHFYSLWNLEELSSGNLDGQARDLARRILESWENTLEVAMNGEMIRSSPRGVTDEAV